MVNKFRIQGPDSTPPNEKRVNEKRTRKDHEHRNVYCSVGRQGMGTCLLETGNTKIMTRVYIQQLKKTPFSCEFKFAPFSGGKRRPYVKDDQEKEYSLMMEQSLRPAIRMDIYPNEQISVHTIILENDGTSACLAAAISSATMALVDAGIEMLDLVIGASCSFSKTLLLDPTQSEEDGSLGTMVLSLMPSLNEVTHVMQNGQVDSNSSIEGISICVDACHQLHALFSQTLLSDIQNAKE
ncbi:ribosomal protein S5 domain 2-type protein [Gorgonomyces haynaldii]|nr:ribosomal protein S5 domain 2-type protein [Gorgonomyces haynaldii]